jgi:hypothetical protein
MKLAARMLKLSALHSNRDDTEKSQEGCHANPPIPS